MSTRVSVRVVEVLWFAALVSAPLLGCTTEGGHLEITPSSLELSAEVGKISEPVMLDVDHHRESYGWRTLDAAGEVADWISYDSENDEDLFDGVTEFEVTASAEMLDVGIHTATTTFTGYTELGGVRNFEIPITFTVLPATTAAR